MTKDGRLILLAINHWFGKPILIGIIIAIGCGLYFGIQKVAGAQTFITPQQQRSIQPNLPAESFGTGEKIGTVVVFRNTDYGIRQQVVGNEIYSVRIQYKSCGSGAGCTYEFIFSDGQLVKVYSPVNTWLRLQQIPEAEQTAARNFLYTHFHAGR